MITESLTLLPTEDNQQVALWQVSDNKQAMGQNQAKPNNKQKNILLTHGTFSDKKIILGMARYLAELGYTCYILEWRGHGTSPKAQAPFNMETIGLYDLKAAFTYLFDELGLPNIHCTTHSGGGLALTMFLLNNPTYIDKVRSIAMFACQAFGAALTPQGFAKVTMTKAMTRTLGYIPARRFQLGTINESYAMMNPWFNWNLGRHFRSSFKKVETGHAKGSPLDYRTIMPTITIPIYALAAKGDTFIAPPRGCQLFLETFANPNNQFREWAQSYGDLEDYSHSRVLMSQNAAKEIWPTVLAWLEKHAA
jgi:alpha-beta hydrolase superfamily lysophospholipase